MIEYGFDSEDLPTADRYDRSRELMSQLPAPYDATTDDIAGFLMRQRDLHVDTLRVWTMVMQPMVLHRTARLIRRSDPETYNVFLLQRGSVGRVWGRHETATYSAGDLHINDSSQPYELRVHGDGPVECLGVEIPKKLLPLPRNRTDGLAGRRMSARKGIGALLGGILTGITTDTGSYLPSDNLRLGTVVVDLASALFAHELEADHTLAVEARQRGLTLRIRGFIERHLGDPDLTPGAVAAAHYISTSYLHRLLQADGITVAAWIRQQRLERARRDLADPAMWSVPIHQIAARWGFAHPAAFSRAFRAAYGITARDYRHGAAGAVDL